MTRRRPMERVGDLLDATARRLGLERELRQARAAGTWEAIVAELVPAAAGASKLVSVEGDVLVVDDLVATGYPVLLGASRKSSVGAVLASAGVTTTAADRDPATGATTALGIAAGVAAVRVHDVPSTVQVARMADAIVRAGREHDDNRNGTE